MSTKGNYVAYYRVSTDHQDTDSQKKFLEKYIGYENICKEFVEFESGKHMSTNKQLREAVKYCKNNNKFLAVSELDRLGRDAEHALAIHRELEGRLYACNIPTEPGAKMDRFALTMFSAIAERERELIALRVKRGMEAAKARGVKFGGYRVLSKKKAREKRLKITQTKINQKLDDPKYHRVKNFILNKIKDFEKYTGKKVPRTIKATNGYIYQEIADELNLLGFEIPDSSKVTNRITEFTSSFVARLYYNENEIGVKRFEWDDK